MYEVHHFSIQVLKSDVFFDGKLDPWAIVSIELWRESWRAKKDERGRGRGEEKRKLSSPSLFLFYALIPTFSTNERGNVCYAGYCGEVGGGGAYEWQLLSGRLQVMVYMLTIHNWTVYLRLRSWFIRNRHCIDWSVRVICVAGVWTWWWSYQSQKHSGYRALKKCSPVGHLGVFYIWNKKKSLF